MQRCGRRHRDPKMSNRHLCLRYRPARSKMSSARARG
nr:MAG TPA: hypothetical protein [Caudoviricetes sp.]